MDGRLLRSEKTRRKILNAAKDVFIEKGFKDATITQIIKKANVGYGTAYTHFKGKDNILIHLMEDVMQQFFEIAHMEYKPINISEAKKKIKQQVVLFLTLARSERQALSVFYEAMGISEKANDQWLKIRNYFVVNIMNDISYVQENGLARKDMDKEIIAKSWFAINEMFLWEIVNGKDERPIDEIANNIVNLYTNGLYLQSNFSK